MKELRYVVVILLLMSFGLALAVPAEDDAETSYDESETLPYESTPLFSAPTQASTLTTQADLGIPSVFFNSSTKRDRR